MTGWLFDGIDLTKILLDADIVTYEECVEECPQVEHHGGDGDGAILAQQAPTVTSTKRKATKIRKDCQSSGSSNKLVLMSGAEATLTAGLAQSNPFTLKYLDPDLELGYRLFHNSSYRPPMLFLGGTSLGYISRAIFSDDERVWLLILINAVVLAIVATSVPLLARGSPIRFKKVATRIAWAEWSKMFCAWILYCAALGVYPDSFGNGDCSEVSERSSCVATSVSGFITSIALAPIISTRFYLYVIYVPIIIAQLVIPQLLTGGTTSAFITTSATVIAPIGSMIFLCTIFVYEWSQRRFFASALLLVVKKLKTEATHDRASGIMASLMPLSVLKPTVKEGKSIFHTASATVVHADIQQVTEWRASRSSMQVVEMLSVVTSSFDLLAAANNCTRTNVLGDGYIAVAGLPDYFTNHAECGVRFALSMQAELTQCCLRRCNWGKMEVQVGVHSGQVSAGVLKQHWAYNIYGEVPKVANMLKSLANGDDKDDMNVLVSEATLNLLRAKMQRGGGGGEVLQRGPDIQRRAVMEGEEEGSGKPHADQEVVRSFRLDNQYRASLKIEPFNAASYHRRSANYTNNQRTQARALVAAVSRAQGFKEHFGSPIVVAGRISTEKDGDDGEEDSLIDITNDEEEEEKEEGKRMSDTRGIPVDIIIDPTPELHAQMTNFSAFIALLCSLTGMLAWALQAAYQSDPRFDGAAFVLAVAHLVVLGVCQCLPTTSPFLTQVKSMLLVAILALGVIVIHPLVEVSVDGSQFAAIFYGLSPLLLVPYLPFTSYWWMSYVVIVASCALGMVSYLVVVPDTDLTTVAFNYAVAVLVACKLRHFFSRRVNRLQRNTQDISRELWYRTKENEALEMVLRLKMPNHVVDRLFTEVDAAGDVLLNASWVIPSCIIALARFEIQDGVNLEGLQAMARLVESLFPSDGTPGHLRHLEKIKTVGDVVMMGGSLALALPDLPQSVPDEEVLLELLYAMEDIEQNIEAEGLRCKCLMGVHKGKVMTGTIGKLNLEYGVFGTTVNTAIRLMESGQGMFCENVGVKEDEDEITPRVFDDRHPKRNKGEPFPFPSKLVAAVCSDQVIQVLEKLNEIQRGGDSGTGRALRPDLELRNIYKGKDAQKITLTAEEDSDGMPLYSYVLTKDPSLYSSS